MNLRELIVGKRYKVTIRHGRSRRVIEGRYMGPNAFHGTHEFDLRPDFGTTGVRPEDIMATEEVK